MSNSNKYLQEYKKEVRRLKQAIRRAEKAGYIVPENIIPKRPKKVTQASVRRLAKITPQKIRDKSQLETIHSKAQIKKDNTQKRKIDKKSKESLKKLRENEKFRKQFSMGEILYRKILDLCDKYSIDNPKGAQLIRGILQDELKTYGKDSVMSSFANIADEEIMTTVEYSLNYSPNSPQSNTALYELTMLIEGNINTESRSKMDKAIESDENWEDISELEKL